MLGTRRTRGSLLLLLLLAALALAALAPEAAAQNVPAPAGAPAATAAASEPASSTAATAAATTETSKLFSEEDGWLDVSKFLDEKYGFLPIVRPITEPAIGFGGAGGLLFLSKPLGSARQGLGRPDITAVLGFGTENGTWGVGAGDMRYWLDDRLQTQVAVLGTSMNLDFYGVGDEGPLSVHPLHYNLQAVGSMAQARYRLFEESNLWMGAGYAFARTEVDFSTDARTRSGTAIPEFSHVEDIAALTPTIMWDTRDTLFTASRGTFIEARCGFFSKVLGGDSDFQRLELVAIQYFPVHEDWTLGLRGDYAVAFGHAPFFLDPYVGLRGAPAMRYQGEDVASIEGEVRWQLWGRWSLVGFTGWGAAWNGRSDGEQAQSVWTGGGGFRYEIAREYRIHMGLDVAAGPDGVALYVVVGSAWGRA